MSLALVAAFLTAGLALATDLTTASTALSATSGIIVKAAGSGTLYGALGL